MFARYRKPQKDTFIKRHRKRNLNRPFADRKPFYLRLKHVPNAAGSERVDEMTEDKLENTAQQKTSSTFAGNQEETKSKFCPSDQVYTASQSLIQPNIF